MELLLLFFFLFFFLSWSNILILKPTLHNEEPSDLWKKKGFNLSDMFFSPFFFSQPHLSFHLLPLYPWSFPFSLSPHFFASSFLFFHSTPPPSPLLPYSLSEHHLFLAVAHEKPSSSPICIAMHFGEFLCLYFNNSWILIDAYQMCLKISCAF